MSDIDTIMSDRELFDWLISQCFSVEPCGSRVTCNPAPLDTDEDYLVELIGANDAAINNVVNTLGDAGFKWEGDNDHYQNVVTNAFMSWRRETTNLIVTSSEDFARRHRAATSVCKRLNLHDKSDRIALFQAVLYGRVEA